MSTSILCVGTELLLGQIDDTNSGYLGRVLADKGIESFEQRKIGDNFSRIKSTVISMLENSDSIIIAGGLGPTHDDITREVVSDVMGAEMVLDIDAEKNMRDIFSRRKREMPQVNLRQAMVPVGAQIIPNENGTAPGLICPIQINGKTKYAFLVPGFPHELKPMVENTIIPFILSKEKTHHVIVNRTLKSWGIPESELSETLENIIEECESGQVKIGFLARGINGIYIKLSTKAVDINIAKSSIENVEKTIQEKIGDFIYAYDDETMESNVLELLREKNATLSIAESFTGGLICSRLVEVSGTSDVLKGSLVAYSEEIKNKLLEIDFGDVYSIECARKMAESTLEKFGSDFAISTTGVSGPGSQIVNGIEHIQGEAYIGFASKEFSGAKKFIFGGDRQGIREFGTISALNILREYLLNPAAVISDLEVGDSSE